MRRFDKLPLAALTVLLFPLLNAADPYLVPNLPESDLQDPAPLYEAALDPTDYSLFEQFMVVPDQDSDSDGFTDLQEFSAGSDVNDPTSTPEKFNLALAMATDWTRDVDPGNGTVDLEERLSQLGISGPSAYLPYLSPTLETQFRFELAELAAELEYDPVKIYQWVYANIEFEDYELSRKGALATYRTGRGNEWDQSSLLITLLRMSGIPARYVAGRQYESVPGLGDQASLKDFVFVQAWTPLVFGDQAWVSLVPWYKNSRITSGINLFTVWDDTNGNGQIEPSEVTATIPEELDITERYLFATVGKQGSITYEKWNGIGGNPVSNLINDSRFPYLPDSRTELSLFEAPSNQGESYGARIVGYLHPTQTADCTFWIASDDYSELWLSTDGSSANKAKIAFVNGATFSRDWTRYGSQKSATIRLEAGRKYYIEALHKEGVGGDHVAVAWEAKDPETNEILFAREVIEGRYLSPYRIDPQTDPDGFETHVQQTSVEYFEKVLQDYVKAHYPSQSLKDVPYEEVILQTPTGVLPRALPYELALLVDSTVGSDAVYADVGAITDATGEEKRALAEIDIWQTPSSSLNLSVPLGYWQANDGTTSTSSTTTDSSGQPWNAEVVGSVKVGQGRRDKAFRFNMDPGINGAYIKLADTNTDPNRFGHQSFDNRTIAMWMYVAEGGTSGTHVIYEEGGNDNGITLRIHNGQLQLHVMANGVEVGSFSRSYGAEMEEEWHYVMAIIAGQGIPNIHGGLVRLLIDGAGGLSLRGTFTVPVHADGAGLGARQTQDGYGNTVTGDYFQGMLDEIIIYDGVVSVADLPLLIGKRMMGRIEEKPLYLPQVAQRRLVLDFESADTTLLPRLQLDGAVWDDGIAGETDLESSDSFEIFYRTDLQKNWKKRPSIRAGALLHIAPDALAATPEGVHRLKEELGNLPTAAALDEDLSTRESYLGRLATLFGETFNHRLAHAQRRVDELFNVKRLYGKRGRNLTLIWTYPGDANGVSDAQISNESSFGLAGGWRIDATFRDSDVYPVDYPVVAYGLEDPLGHLTAATAFHAASYNEALVFEDWQGTPGLSTIAGIFAALYSADNELVFYNGDETEQEIRDQLQLSDKVEDQIVSEVTRQGALVWTPVKAPAILYPEGHPNAGEPAVQSDVRLTDTPNNISWSYGQFNGGQSGSEIDDEALVDTTEEVDLADFGMSNPALLAQATLEGAQADFINACQNDQVARSVYTGGDPVDLVTGEFFLEEPADINIRSRGFPLSIVRKYKSQVVYNGPFGYGWTWNHGESLLFGDGNIIFYDSERRPLCLGDGTNLPSGATFTFEQSVDSQGATIYVLTTKLGLSMTFSADGLLLEKRDLHDNTLTFEYSGSGTATRMIHIRDALGRELELSYNDPANPDKVTEVTDFTGRSVAYAYDANGDLIGFSDAADNLYAYEYLSGQENPLNDHNLAKQTLPNGDYLNLFYYKNDTVSHHRNKTGSTFHFQYSWLNRYSETWNEEGYYQKIFYNPRWDVIRIETQDKALELREYDLHHNLTALIDGNGNRTEYQYDAQRNMTAMIDPLGNAWVYEYDPDLNRRTIEIDPKGVVGELFYDFETGNLIRAEAATKRVAVNLDEDRIPAYDLDTPMEAFEFPVRGTIRFEYDSYGNLLKEIRVLEPAEGENDEVALVTQSYYAINGVDRTRTIDARGNETQYYYDDLGRVVAVQDPLGHITQTEYNAYDAPVHTVAADGGETTSEYDQNRRVEKITHPNGGISEMVYGSPFYVDHVDRVLEEIDALGHRVKHSYDASGNRITSTDRRGATTRFIYDRENRLIETIDALGNSIRHRYDGNGNRIATTDARGNTIEWDYDAANRRILQRETWDDRRAVWSTYDANGNVTAVIRGYIDNVGDFVELDRTEHSFNARNHRIKTIANAGQPNARVTLFEYDSIGRLTAQEQANALEEPLRKSEFDYDANGNRTATRIYAYDSDLGDWEATPQREIRIEYDARNAIAITYDGNNHPTTYAYDPIGRRILQSTNVDHPLNGQPVAYETHTTYDRAGNVIRAETYAGTTPTGRSDFTYNLRNERITATDALGYTTALRYDPNGNRIESTDPAGFVTRTYYDALNRILVEEDALGNAMHFEYDANSNVVATVTPLGERSTFSYNENNERVAQSDALGNTIYFDYDERGRQVSVTDARGNTSSTIYNDFDEVITVTTPVTLPDGTIENVTTSNLYDVLGSLFQSIDARGTVTEYHYDALDQVIEMVQAKGTSAETITVSEYDGNGNLILQERGWDTDEAVVTEYAYDALNRPIRTTVGLGESNPLTSLTQYLDTELKQVDIDPYGAETTSEFDLLGRTVTVTDALGHTTSNEYDRRGNLIRQNYPSGSPDAALEYEYDGLNRLIVQRQGGAARTMNYDANGRIHEEVDFNGHHKIRYFYDAAGRRIRTVQAVGTPEEAITKFAYDENGNLLKVVDANHAVRGRSGVGSSATAIMTYAYDELNRRMSEMDASGAVREIDYDANGNAELMLLRDGAEVLRQYDALNRVVAVNVAQPESSAYILEQVLNYDSLSRLLRVIDYNQGRQTHTVEYAYDFANRAILEEAYDSATRPQNLGAIRTVQTDYDRVADPSISQAILKTYPSSRIFKGELDKRGQLFRLTDMNVNRPLSELSYDSLGRAKTLNLYKDSGTVVINGSLNYDTRGREGMRDYSRAGTTLFRMDSDYDANSNVKSENVSGTLPTMTGTQTYDHDALDRLIDQDNSGVGLTDLFWDYDKVGNWVKTNQNAPTLSEERVVNADNEYTSVNSETSVVNPVYDAKGNLSAYDLQTYSYDWANRLIEVKDNGTTVATYTYDGANRRVTKTVGAITTTYAYDNSQVVQEYENSILKRSFVYGDYIDAPVALYDESGGSHYYYLRDRRANIVGLVDESGVIIESYEYTPFGSMTIYDIVGTSPPQSTIGNPYGFSGRRYDAESGLWYYRNRMYSAELGRFLQRDPAGFVDGYNLYAYVANNPLRFVDPLGLTRIFGQEYLFPWEDGWGFSQTPAGQLADYVSELTWTDMGQSSLNMVQGFQDTVIQHFSFAWYQPAGDYLDHPTGIATLPRAFLEIVSEDFPWIPSPDGFFDSIEQQLISPQWAEGLLSENSVFGADVEKVLGGTGLLIGGQWRSIRSLWNNSITSNPSKVPSLTNYGSYNQVNQATFGYTVQGYDSLLRNTGKIAGTIAGLGFLDGIFDWNLNPIPPLVELPYPLNLFNDVYSVSNFGGRFVREGLTDFRDLLFNDLSSNPIEEDSFWRLETEKITLEQLYLKYIGTDSFIGPGNSGNPSGFDTFSPTSPPLDTVPQSYNNSFGTGDPLGEAIFGGSGGQSVSFVDRSRLNNRGASGRSIFTGRGNVLGAKSKIKQLFR